MRDEVNWKGEVYELEWFDGVDFEALDNVVQVYGFVFDEGVGFVLWIVRRVIGVC